MGKRPEKSVNKNPKTNAEAFELVLSFFGPRHGAKTALGAALDPPKTRQAVDMWGKQGIPPKYYSQLRKLTGLTSKQIAPEHF